MELKPDQISDEFNDARDDIVNAICNGLKVLEEYDINTPLRLAHFLGQCADESGGFRVIEENLNYSAQTLARLFPTHFTDDDPSDFAKQPEKIANHIYCDRMGNGDESSGDGWRYRGRGLIQLTGKQNYQNFADKADLSLDDVVQYLTTPEGAVESAAWFWQYHGLNDLADGDDVKKVTKRVNGGTIGLAERQAYTEAFKDILGVS